MKKTEQINVDYNDVKSIKKAEQQKFKLECKGYTIVNTICRTNNSATIYLKLIT